MKRTLLLTLFTASCATASFAAQPPATDDTHLSAAKMLDGFLAKEWKANGLSPNAEISDDIFVRRLYLDLVGRIPTYREGQAFLQSKEANKRGKLIDQLLASEGYVQHMYNYWADILRLQTNGNQAGPVTGAAYSDFIKTSLRQNKPYDKLVREMVAATGYAWDNPAIGYYMRDRGMPLDNMANTVRIFLGTRIECAQCHNHPFDRWKQMDFFQMAAFTYGADASDYGGESLQDVRKLMSQKERELRDSFKPAKDQKVTDDLKAKAKAAQEKLREHQRYVQEALSDVRNSLRYTSVAQRDRKLTLPHDYQYTDAKPKSAVTAATMLGEKVVPAPGENPLEVYAKWMTSKENPRFTKVISNRLWKKAFGVGLIEPVDELMDNTEASNPELMSYLERLMISLNYDMKAYMRILMNTKTYQRAVSREEAVPGVVYHFTGPVLRRMTAEQMWDSFVTLINPTPDMPNYILRQRSTQGIANAEQIYDSLQAFGPEAILKGAELSGEEYKKQSGKVREMQKQLSEARAAENKEKVKEINQKLSDLNRQVRSSVKENIFVPAAMKLASSKGGKPDATVASKSESASMMDGGNSSMMMSSDGATMMIPGVDRVPEIRHEMSEAELKQLRDEAVYFGIKEEKNIERYIKVRQQNIRTWLRSAEIESPAPRGHYLREFGQSDRETIENGNTDASVPQALAMMNSQLLPQIMDGFSSLMLTVNMMPYPDEKMEAVYMTLLSRMPTSQEREVWNKASEKGLNTLEDLIYALINTQQFIFIQ